MIFRNAYDNGGKTADRYTIVFKQGEEYHLYFMSSDANMPNGICMYGGSILGYGEFGKRINFNKLPNGVKKQIEFLEENNITNECKW